MSNGIIPKSGILVLDGYGLKVKVEKGHLVLEDGIGRDRHSYRMSKITKLKRLVILGHTGFVTFEAMRWLHDRGTAVVMIDADGEILMCEAAMRLDWPTLRRAQALVSGSDFGVELGRSLIRRKLQGQGVPGGFITALDSADSIAAIRGIEADAAQTYWRSMRELVIKWDKPVPEHWKGFDRRQSHLAKNPRNATDPFNALLNYAYRLAEIEVRIACLSYGLDLGLGLLHVDESARDNFVLDLLEVLRPEIDRFVLDIVSGGLTKSDFHESRDGHVRILQPMTARLVESLPRWRDAAGALVEEIASILNTVELPAPASVKAARASKSVPSLLTRSRARAAAKAS